MLKMIFPSKFGRSYSKKYKFRNKVIYLANNTPVNWDYAKFWVDFLLYCCIYQNKFILLIIILNYKLKLKLKLK